MDAKKLRSLVEYLYVKDTPITAKELAKFLNMSVRTVKNYIALINQEETESVIYSSRAGYEVYRERAEIYIKTHRDERDGVPHNYEERMRYINQKFLKYHTKKIDCYALAEELNFSIETIRADFQRMNSSFENYGISYEIHGDFVYLRADEQSLRKLAHYIYFSDMPEQTLDYSVISKVFNELDVYGIKRIVESALRCHHLYINDFGLVNVVLHISIIIQRIKAQNQLPMESEIRTDSENLEYQAVEEICSKLEKLFQIVLNAAEKNNIFLLIRANANLIIEKEQNDFYDYIGEELLDFVRFLVKGMNEKYYVEMSNDTFLLPFAMHVKNVIFRAKIKQKHVNPMREIIRYSHPTVFDMAVFCACQIKEKYRIEVDENEIAYIALHIGGELERQKINTEKIRTVLLCPSYLGFASKIYNRILIDYGDEIELLGCVNSIDEISDFRCQLVISTLDVNLTNAHFKFVNIPLLENSLRKSEIGHVIEEIKEKQQLQMFKKYFKHYFSENMFFINRDKKLKNEDAMKLMADQMIRVGVVQKDFFEQLMERERGASTGFPNIAIPHSLHMNAIKTSICVMICPNEMTWGTNQVKIVFTIAISKTDGSLFGELYQTLIKLFDNEKTLKQIITVNSYGEFIEQIERLL